MEKNWIDEVVKAIKLAMKKNLKISKNILEDIDGSDLYTFMINHNINYSDLAFDIYKDHISLYTKNGHLDIKHQLSSRDELKLRELLVLIEEYHNDVALLEFGKFICADQKDTPKNIDELDDGEE